MSATAYDKTVRFYFGISISCLIPRNAFRRRDGVSDAAWEKRHIERIEADLNATLAKKRFEIAYRKHEVVDDARRLYVAHFVVSVAHEFAASVLYTPRKGYDGFCVKAKKFLSAKTSLEAAIRDALKSSWVVNAISYEYAASWGFV